MTTWQEFYSRSVAHRAGVDPALVEIVCRHDHVVARYKGQLVASGFCVELSYDDDGRAETVYAWDEPPFVMYRKRGRIQSPEDALIAFVVSKHRRRRK